MTSSFPLPAVRADPSETEPVRDNTGYSVTQIRGWLRSWHFLCEGRFPPDDHAPDPRARGKVQFESKPPAPAAIVHADLSLAIDALPLILAETVKAVADAGSFGRAARWLRTPKSTVADRYYSATNLMTEFLGGVVEG